MKIKNLALFIVCLFFTLTVSNPVLPAQKIIKLPRPDVKGGIPLMAAINSRHSSRSFSDKALSDQTLSNLLWAANGINRADSGKRTVPSAMDKQEIDVYAALKDGLYLYNAKNNQLELIVDKDIRELTGKQPYVKEAALNLVYVADMNKVAGENNEDKLIYAAADTGFVGENVYLYCASEGLQTVIRAFIDKDTLARAMGLKANQRIILSQTVGYPGK